MSSVPPGCGVGVTVAAIVPVGVAMGVSVAAAVPVGVPVGANVRVGVGTSVAVSVGEGTSVGVVTTMVGVAVDVRSPSPSSPPPQAAVDTVNETQSAVRRRRCAMSIA